jgi:hypothetical protein
MRVADSSTFVALLELDDGREDPRQAIPEYTQFLERLKDWVDGPPLIEQLDVVGSYNLFGAQREECALDWVTACAPVTSEGAHRPAVTFLRGDGSQA